MYFAINIGNTTILLGLMKEQEILFTSRLHTDRRSTADEYAVMIRELLYIHGVSVEDVHGAIVSSVVPALQTVISEAIQALTGHEALMVGPGVKNGLKIRIDDPGQLGAGQVAYAVAAAAYYSMPAIVLGISTATSFSVLDRNGSYIGGVIMPGIRVSLDALTGATSQLPQIGLAGRKAKVIGTNTIDAMRSGVLHGTAASLDGMIAKIRAEIGEDAMVIATGRQAKEIIPYCSTEIVYDQDLVLKGLGIIYEKNRK
ncbi:MAG: type III pantothenate kinase [Eubacteriales bacterium]|nr:type III pantothenate kinase [Eubacteriales bacterium]